MARRRQGTQSSERVAEDGDVGTWEWAPSCPRRPPTHNIRVDNDNRLCILAYCADWAAKKAVDIIIGENKYKWLNERTIHLDSGVRIKSDQLEEIMECEVSERHQEWDFPPEEMRKLNQVAMSTTEIEQVREERQARRVERGEAVVRSPKVKKDRVSREARKGMTTIQSLCEELGVDPRDARRVLRKSSFKKGDMGWAWSEGEAVEVRKFLTKQKWD